MSAANKAVVQAFNQALVDFFRTGDLGELLAAVDQNAVVSMPGLPANFDGIKEVLPMFRTAFPDFSMSVYDLIAEGDQVAYRITWTATHQGELMGIPPTNKRITVTETHIDRIVDGKIVEHAGDWDQLGVLQQVGAVPAPPH
jgi:predicted ester cyclase